MSGHDSLIRARCACPGDAEYAWEAKERRYIRTVKTEARAAAELARLLRDVEPGERPTTARRSGYWWIGTSTRPILEVSTRKAHEGYVWRTISNPAEKATPPHAGKSERDPPSPAQAGRLLNDVWQKDEQFGLYLWAAFTTGLGVASCSPCARAGSTSRPRM